MAVCSIIESEYRLAVMKPFDLFVGCQNDDVPVLRLGKGSDVVVGALIGTGFALVRVVVVLAAAFLNSTGLAHIVPNGIRNILDFAVHPGVHYAFAVGRPFVSLLRATASQETSDCETGWVHRISEALIEG